MKLKLLLFLLLTPFIVYILQSKEALALSDTTPPTTTYVKTPAVPNGKNGWYVSNVTVDLTATDLASGVAEINYAVDGGAFQKVTFPDSLNLIQNPSFETLSELYSSGIDMWDSSVVDANGTVTQDVTSYAPGFAIASAKITATSGVWHGVNNKTNFAAASPYDNMTTSVWLMSQSVIGTAYYNVYAVNKDVNGVITHSLLTTSSAISGNVGWSQLSASFSVNSATAIGIYIDVGISGTGTLWVDAANASSAAANATTSINIGSNNSNHTIEYYAVDKAGNIETHACASTPGPLKNCVSFKLDQTPPQDWEFPQGQHGVMGNKYNVYAYINVHDYTSGFDEADTSQYVYHTELNPGYGRFSSLLSCSSTWQPNVWTIVNKEKIRNDYVRLRTPKTSFCNDNWSVCKIVRFLAEDAAGNTSTKDICINGPWIKTQGGGIVRSNNNITMLALGSEDNASDLISVSGSLIDFFTSTKNWKAKNTPAPANLDYNNLSLMAPNKTAITQLNTNSGTFIVNGDFTLNSSSVPAGYATSQFTQVVFVNGNLTVGEDILVSANSAVLFVVKGDVNVDKSVRNLQLGFFADGNVNTAYNLVEGDTSETLNLNGVFSANKFSFTRTLHGTDNSDTPAENFTYEPKFLILFKDYFGAYSVKWLESK